ncbi:TIGR04282 family arsenosugar biosynthesis glycosyltransferase [Ulvibacter antarcticus]|uniref:Glycosyltransferase n=1 Tax=Ulvibacter antarcticus TaxID=442714 RepID=A0A3L9Z7P3_9FLAO|nr:TIGR04282 family arsenosugar biosynthesis glycosyltransferase [Ulvibacter antarcticus]RMA66468.1 hypothetical protein BXY75_0893 [Ulvibacter antarcticus]
MALLANKNTDDDKHFVGDFHFPTSKKALIIFTRNPELGKCKTRLAATIGDAAALEVYKVLLKHTADITKNLNVDKFVFYSEAIYKNDSWDDTVYRKHLQLGEDLGIRMENAFKDVFSMGYESAIIIGSDMYDLSQKDLEEAFQVLTSNNLVIGPAQDGGYYLLGMKEVFPALFKGKNWGTDSVLQNTLEDLKNETYIQLSLRNDIDYYEDMKDIEALNKFVTTISN